MEASRWLINKRLKRNMYRDGLKKCGIARGAKPSTKCSPKTASCTTAAQSIAALRSSKFFTMLFVRNCPKFESPHSMQFPKARWSARAGLAPRNNPAQVGPWHSPGWLSCDSRTAVSPKACKIGINTACSSSSKKQPLNRFFKLPDKSQSRAPEEESVNVS